jgi:hypothetical protein
VASAFGIDPLHPVTRQNEYVERLIGSIRRECIVHVIVLGEAHLPRIMSRYACYYNHARTHLALAKDAPVGHSVQPFGRIIAEPMVAVSIIATLGPSFR